MPTYIDVIVPPLDLNVVVPIGANAYAYLYSKDILVDESGNILVDESGNTLTAIRADLQWVYQVNVPPLDLSVTVEEAT